MAISPFVFTSDNLPRLKAKQLVKTFPFLKLAAAQEATARALGYASWYECTTKGAHGSPSLPDEKAGIPVRVARYYHQASVLMGLGITPMEADVWVRGWGLTGRPTLAPQKATPLYYFWLDIIERLERGEITEDQAIKESDGDDESKYPEIDLPHRVCPGVILGPCGKYPNYAVDPLINANIPTYLRGPYNLYHYEDDGDVLAMCVPGFPFDVRPPLLGPPRLNVIQYEWHHGEKHPESNEPLIPKMVKAALDHRDALIAISYRAMPNERGAISFDNFAVACLCGGDFARFLQAKGVINPEKVIWYRDISASELDFSWREHLGYLSIDRLGVNGFAGLDGAKLLPIFKIAEKHKPGPPIYSYPFMTAPMHEDEYSAFIERMSLLPLDQDYQDDHGGNDGGGGNGGDDVPPWDPAPSDAEQKTSLVPA